MKESPYAQGSTVSRSNSRMRVNASMDSMNASTMSMSKDPTQQLFAARLARVHSENDVQILNNRLARLRQEEFKALKKIEETKKRTDEIKAYRKRNEQLQREREEQRRKEAEEKRKKELARKAMREQQRNAINGSKQALLRVKKEGVTEIKREREYNKELMRQNQVAQKKMIEMKKFEHATQKDDLVDKRRQEKEDEINSLARELESQLSREEVERRHNTKLLNNMEEEEIRLIERLKQMQDMQRQAYVELEKALSSNTAS